MDQKAQEGKQVVLLYSQTPPEEASIHTAEMKAIKTAMKEVKERDNIRWVIYTLVEFNADHREQQKISQY